MEIDRNVVAGLASFVSLVHLATESSTGSANAINVRSLPLSEMLGLRAGGSISSTSTIFVVEMGGRARGGSMGVVVKSGLWVD